MKITFARPARDLVRVERDGTVVMSFMESGYIRGISRVRFSADSDASLNALSLTTATQQGNDEAERTAPHALVFVSESSTRETIRIIERFDDEGRAKAALALVRSAIERSARSDRFKSRLRNAGLYVLVPILAIGLYGALSSALSAKTGSPELAAAIVAEANRMATPAPRPFSQPESLRTALSDPRRSILLTPDNKRSPEGDENAIFVFSDPKCPACRQAEPMLEEIAQHTHVYVLPVAYKDGSEDVVIDALCGEDSEGAWRAAMAEEGRGNEAHRNDAVKPSLRCLPGIEAMRRNRADFEKMGLTKTPSAVLADGTVVDLRSVSIAKSLP